MTGTPDSPVTVPMTANEAVLVRKTARDTGFDVPGAPDAGWLPVRSTHAPVRVWIGKVKANGYVIAVSMHSVAVALERPLVAGPAHLPVGAVDTVLVTGDPDLRATLKRIHQLSRSLPSHPLDEFRRKTAGLPTTTEAERLTVVRVGQDTFRDGLLAYWDGACAITGLSVPDLLRASHAKPWASCDTDDERLDTHNGLLLAGHLDLAFDQGYITVAPDGAVEVSARLDGPARAILTLDSPRRISRIVPAHRPYLAWHRERVFRC